MKYLIRFITLFIFTQAGAQNNYVKEHFNKTDTLITMRDGIRLYTVIYTPKNQTRSYAILMERTPYSAGPYGNTSFSRSVGPNDSLMKEGYIFVLQDVRGRYMSEGVNLEVTPHIANKKSNKDVDESSDTYDTVDWLIKNIKNNNGRVGIYGISYPGFYATASLPGAHPALRAVSPQAPVTDEFIGDDANHGGAFFLLDNFNFMGFFDRDRDSITKKYKSPFFNTKPTETYPFYLKMGSVKNTNSERYFNRKSRIWNEYLEHDIYDTYWKDRNIRPHLKNISIPTLVVGGWFDAEDLFGSLHTYEAIEKQSSSNYTSIVMGPWTHGAWAGNDWSKFGTYQFGSNTCKMFQDSLETPFFNYYLYDKGRYDLAEATMFNTGNKQWERFASWPPKNMAPTVYYFQQLGELNTLKPTTQNSFSEYLSDPNKPVPYTAIHSSRRNNEYMVEDQRFAAQRPDVLVFETTVLENDLTLAGSVTAELQTSISTTDADFVVKLIDVLPDNEPNPADAPRGTMMGGFQRMVRADILRGKFRKSFEKPVPFTPGKTETVTLHLNDVLHTFKKGHKMMVQVQSSWFPLADRNPQQFLKIPEAKESDFIRSTIKIYHDKMNASKIILPVLNNQ
jgi:putative CocE/NonD family hydrolase